MFGAFRCEACALELADGVDYTWCPKCGGPVTATGAMADVAGTAPPPWQVARFVLGVGLVVQAVFALVDPHGFPYLAPLVVIALVAALPAVVAMIVFVPAVRALLREHIRIIHGLEHATIAVLEQRGVAVRSGVTLRVRGVGMFDLEFANDGRNRERAGEIRSAATEAIRRVAAGERELAYSPRCGTSYIVGVLVLAIAVGAAAMIALVLGAPTGYAYVGMVAALVVARLASRPLGLAAQRAFTVTSRFASARVDAIEREVSPRGDAMYYAVYMTVEPIAGLEVAEPI